MAANLFERRNTEPRDTGGSAWTEIPAIVITLIVVMVALIIANTVFS
jgi:hypothetical protein